jgi:hypothetical protein
MTDKSRATDPHAILGPDGGLSGPGLGNAEANDKAKGNGHDQSSDTDNPRLGGAARGFAVADLAIVSGWHAASLGLALPALPGIFYPPIRTSEMGERRSRAQDHASGCQAQRLCRMSALRRSSYR